VQDFRNVSVWKKAHELVLRLYQATVVFPKDETYGLRSQIRREAVLIPSKIAEGCGSGSDPEFARCLRFAMGTASQVEYLIPLAYDLGYFSTEADSSLQDSIVEVKKMITGFLNKLR
jgi:four helix bundle protein